VSNDSQDNCVDGSSKFFCPDRLKEHTRSGISHPLPMGLVCWSIADACMDGQQNILIG
tara:strand:- start:464 stop:637 length:174 start_codon:yes stop_codon:yes gene_type:complete